MNTAKISSDEVTPPELYLNRRQLMRAGVFVFVLISNSVALVDWLERMDSASASAGDTCMPSTPAIRSGNRCVVTRL